MYVIKYFNSQVSNIVFLTLDVECFFSIVNINLNTMKQLFRNNGLSIAFLLLFLFSIIGQIATGVQVHNAEMEEKGGKQLSVSQYLSSGHFIQSTFENWESEFLQMGLFVIMTIFLFQKGSSES